MKKILAIILVAALLAACLAGCAGNKKTSETTAATETTVTAEETTASAEQETTAGQTQGNVSAEDEKLINDIVEYFMPLTEIPRQSHHEEKISEYLVSWAKERGFDAIQDDENNVIFDVPGTEGMEKAPVTVLQAHMDMVIAVEDGKTFDPQKDGITVINDGVTLTADGTSLGADDGMGVATILYIIEKNDSHGPLRIIFTTNEEDGMTGAFGLTTDKVDGVKYVINVDSENSTEVTNSSAAGVIVNFTFAPEVVAPTKKQAANISISGLSSGHSGIDIDKGHVNGIKAVSYIINRLADEGIDYELASLVGGSANNAIPASATACIVYDAEDEAAIEEYIADFKDAFSQLYGGIEINFEVELESCDIPSSVFSAESKANVLKFTDGLFDGVNSMSPYVEGLVESSSNFGLVSISAENSESTGSTYVRSSDDTKLHEIVDSQMSLAKECGFGATETTTADPWPVNPDSKLLEMVKEAYLKENGTEISVVQLHAGLETGTFSKLNPELDIVSIGFDIKNPHTINETCYLQTIPTTYRMLEDVLTEIGNEK